MKLRHLFLINFIFACFFGSACSFLPRFTFSLYGVIADAPSIWTCRLVGGSILGFATLMWFGMKSTSVESRKAIAAALLIQDTIGFGASLIFQLADKVNFFGWLSLGLYGMLALAYSYFLLIKRAYI